jgi:type IV pilus assembly protein PilQ
MKKVLREVMLVSFFWLLLFLPGLNADSDPPLQLEEAKEITISLDLQDVHLKELLKILSIQSGLNFIASQALQDRTMTLYLDKVPLKQAMDKIFSANNLTYELDKEANVFVVKDWGAPQVETLTKVYQLKYQAVPSSDLGKETAGANTISSLQSILSSRGKIVEDTRTNSLVISDEPKRFPLVEQLLAKLDVPQPQVMLEVEMLDVNKELTDKIGFNWNKVGTYTLAVSGAARRTKFPFASMYGEGTPSDLKGITGITTQPAFSVSGLSLTLDFLRTQADTKSLARPKIRTLNNQTAEIKISTDEVINSTSTVVTGTATTTSTTIERATTGITLKVTPMINLDKGEITMSIFPTEKATSTSSLVATAKDIEERSVKSIVKVKDGETIIIGGLIRKQLQQTITKLPVLGDLPLLGVLFRHKDKSRDKERELLVFITPRIIQDADIKLAQTAKTALPEREQNVVSGVNRQVAISNYLNNYDKKSR